MKQQATERDPPAKKKFMKKPVPSSALQNIVLENYNNYLFI